MTFCRNGMIGHGAAGMEAFWDIRRVDGVLNLEIKSRKA